MFEGVDWDLLEKLGGGVFPKEPRLRERLSEFQKLLGNLELFSLLSPQACLHSSQLNLFSFFIAKYGCSILPEFTFPQPNNLWRYCAKMFQYETP